MTPEEIIIDNVENSTSWVLSYDMIYEVIIPCMEEYGKQQWNEAIKLAAEEAKLLVSNYKGEWESDNERLDEYTSTEISKNSILKLLK